MNPGGRFVPVLCEEEAESAGGTKEDSPALVSSSPGGTSPPAVVGLHLFAIEMGSGTYGRYAVVGRLGILGPHLFAGVRRSRWGPARKIRPAFRRRRSRSASRLQRQHLLAYMEQGTAPRIHLLVLHVSAEMWQLTRPVQVSLDLELELELEGSEAARSSSSTHVSCSIAGHSIANKSELSGRCSTWSLRRRCHQQGCLRVIDVIVAHPRHRQQARASSADKGVRQPAGSPPLC